MAATLCGVCSTGLAPTRTPGYAGLPLLATVIVVVVGTRALPGYEKLAMLTRRVSKNDRYDCHSIIAELDERIEYV